MSLNIGAIRAALAAQLQKATGLRALGEPRDAVNVPCLLILPGAPYAHYGETMGEYGASTVGLRVLILLSDASTVERTLAQMDGLLGTGPSSAVSVPAAIMADPSLGGACPGGCLPLSASAPGRTDYAGETYMGAYVQVQVIA